MRLRRPPVVTACLLAGLVCLPAGPAELSRAALDPQRVVWRELRYTAHKLGMSASVAVRLDDGAAAAGDASKGGPDAAGGDDIVLESTTHLPGRVFMARERVDPLQARARWIVDTETGAKVHRKTYTLTTRGFFLDLLEPASHAQAALGPEHWTRASRSFTGYPRQLPPGAAITGPIGLLYAVSAAPLTSPGDALSITVLVQTHIERVTLQVEGVEAVALDFNERAGGTERAVRGSIAALKLAVHSQPVDPAATSAFRIFGLGGDVEMLWDPVRRLPVEIAGSVKILGRVRVHLSSVTLR